MYNFNNEKNKIEKELNNLIKRCDRISNIKIIVSIAGVLQFLYNRKNPTISGWSVFVLLCVIFIILLVQHERVLKQREYAEGTDWVVNKYQLRAVGKWTSFEDTGTEFLSEQSYLERDLDIMGEKSLYQYLCVANTVEGKKRLAEYLTLQNVDYKRIQENRAAIEELIEKYDFRLKIETLGVLGTKKSKYVNDEWYYGFIQYLEGDDNNKGQILKTAIIMPIVLVIIFCLAYCKILSYGYLLPILLVQIVITYYISYKNRDVINKLNQFCLGLDNVIGILECITNEPFDSPLLLKLQAEINGDSSLLSGIKKLSGIKGKFSMQRNLYVHVFLQIIFMYDVHCMRGLEAWKRTYGKNFRKIYLIIGEIEALLSLSSMALVKNVTFPHISNSEKPRFEAKDIYHPLIDSEKVVSNTINVTKGVNIITGSNMSGKSTFMRTMGINMVLAYTGAPVCAKEMYISIMKLYTCMRVTDDVFIGRSSFYAEVLRIKTIVNSSRNAFPMFVIIDEIFKGTNSLDRITGAKEIIRKLYKPYIMMFISTHDLEICELIDTKELQGSNYHFMEQYEKNEILFDYKLKDGKCKSRNAKYILKMAGLLD